MIWLHLPFTLSALHNLAFTVACAAFVCAEIFIYGLCICRTCIVVRSTKARKILRSFACVQQQRGPFGFRFVQDITDIHSYTHTFYSIEPVYAYPAQYLEFTQAMAWVLSAQHGGIRLHQHRLAFSYAVSSGHSVARDGETSTRILRLTSAFALALLNAAPYLPRKK